MIIVLDASVIIKWFLKEENSESALQFKEDFISGKIDIAIPDLALYEICNVLRFKPNINEEAAKNILPGLFNLGLEIITPSSRLLTESFHLSFATGLSIYDCVYLALANELEAKLITADKRIFTQAEPLCKIKLLN